MIYRRKEGFIIIVFIIRLFSVYNVVLLFFFRKYYDSDEGGYKW